MFNCVIDSPVHIINFIILITKQYLYAQRCLKLPANFIELKARINMLKNTEYYIAKKNNNVTKHLAKWQPAS